MSPPILHSIPVQKLTLRSERVVLLLEDFFRTDWPYVRYLVKTLDSALCNVDNKVLTFNRTVYDKHIYAHCSFHL